MKKVFIAILILLLAFLGCSKTEKQKNMNDLDVDMAFAFNTTRAVTVDIEGPAETDFNLFLAYDGDLKEGKGDTLLLDDQIVQTMTDSTGKFKDILTIPSYYDEVFLQSGEYIEQIPIIKPNPTEGEIIDVFAPSKSELAKTTGKCATIKYYYPSKNKYGTMMFEDLWPNTGDYDLNDLVIDCNYTENYDQSSWIYVPPAGSFFYEIYEVDAKFKIRATGASYKISFGFQLPDICYINGNVTSTLPQGLQIEQDNNTIICIFDVHQALGSPSGTWTNTDESMPYYDPVEFTLTIPVKYVSGDDPAWVNWVNNSDDPIYYPPYNPFIYVNNDRGHEIHLANYPPTDSMNTDLFDTGNDASDPAAGIYFRTINGLPWGVNVGRSTLYMKETIPIIDGFNHFAEWAESGGTVYTNWYRDRSGFINHENIYTEP